MKRIALCVLVAVAVILTFVGASLAQATPEFKLGFKALADQIPDVAGTPQEEEHYGSNGDSLQQTSTGLMAWRKADNWTAFTNGSRTWVNGPNGVQERGNEERFSWEARPPAPTATPLILPTPIPLPTATASPTPLPRSVLRGSQPNVIQGQGLESTSTWILGEVRNEGPWPAYNVTVVARLLSSSGDVVATANQAFAYVGPGATVAYRTRVSDAPRYASVAVSFDSSPTGFASFDDMSISWVKNEQTHRQQGTRLLASYQFTGILKNGGNRPVSLSAVYVWFLDDQDRVVWMDSTYITPTLAPGDSQTFMIQTPWDSDNPRVNAISRVQYYAAGQWTP